MEMAREAGFHVGDQFVAGAKSDLEAFAKLVRADERNRMIIWTPENWTDYERSIAAAEREACAKECERMMLYPNARQQSAAHQNVWEAAKAIRARGQE